MFIKLRPTALGAITQLYAGTTPDAKELNGKVSVLTSLSRLFIQSARSILFHGHELVRPEKTLWTKSWARSCFLGSRSKLLRRCSRNRRHDQVDDFGTVPVVSHFLAILLHIYSFCSLPFFCVYQLCHPRVLSMVHLLVLIVSRI